MKTTYEMIRDIPGKGADWAGMVEALTAHYLAVYAATHNGAEPWAANGVDMWKAAKGVRELRTAAMEAANFTVGAASVRSSFIAPSEETLSWGGFLGGETVVWKDMDAAEKATAEIAEIIKPFVK